MIVQCNECNSRYRIAGEKLPSGGGKIKCPNCANVFRVESATVAAPVAEAESIPEVEAAALLAGVNADGEPTSGGWKLRNAMGLVFEFPDTPSIARWLQARDSFDGIEVSGDKGTTWHTVPSIPSLASPKAGSRRTIAGMPALVRPKASATAAAAAPVSDATAADVPATDWSQPGDLKRQAEERLRVKRAERAQQAPAAKADAPSRPYRQVRRAPKRKSNIFVMAATVLALFAIIIVVLEMQGVIAVGEIFAGSSSQGTVPDALRPSDGTTANAGSGANSESGATPDAPTEEDAIVQQLIIDAEQQALSGDPQGSVRTLERARGIDAESADVYCRLSVAYERAERIDDARAAQARCTELQE